MALILHIDTAVEESSVCIAENGKLLSLKKNPDQKDSASWLQPAIQMMLQEEGMSISKIDAVAVTEGPGSYTGLRVGMSSAKGICYALDKPLITISSLKMMAAAAMEVTEDSLLCPMIDARRVEVFTAIYDRSFNELHPQTNMILDEHSFESILKDKEVVFFGNGSKKFSGITKSPHAKFTDVISDARNLVKFAWEKFVEKNFADLAYAEPLYGKAFFSPLFNETSRD